VYVELDVSDTVFWQLLHSFFVSSITYYFISEKKIIIMLVYLWEYGIDNDLFKCSCLFFVICFVFPVVSEIVETY